MSFDEDGRDGRDDRDNRDDSDGQAWRDLLARIRPPDDSPGESSSVPIAEQRPSPDEPPPLPAPIPHVRLLSGDVIPDLRRIPRARWREALVPLSRRLRTEAALRAGREHCAAALELGDALPPAPSLPQTGPRVPLPTAQPRPGLRQMTLRLSTHDYAELERAGGVLGCRPAQLARMLVLNGTRRVIAEHGAALDRVRFPDG